MSVSSPWAPIWCQRPRPQASSRIKPSPPLNPHPLLFLLARLAVKRSHLPAMVYRFLVKFILLCFFFDFLFYWFCVLLPFALCNNPNKLWSISWSSSMLGSRLSLPCGLGSCFYPRLWCSCLDVLLHLPYVEVFFFGRVSITGSLWPVFPSQWRSIPLFLSIRAWLWRFLSWLFFYGTRTYDVLSLLSGTQLSLHWRFLMCLSSRYYLT